MAFFITSATILAALALILAAHYLETAKPKRRKQAARKKIITNVAWGIFLALGFAAFVSGGILCIALGV